MSGPATGASAADAGASAADRRVVLLTPGGKLVEAVLAELARRGAAAPPVLLYRKAADREWRRARTVGGRARALARLPLLWVRTRSAQRMHARALAPVCDVTRTDTLAGARIARDLRRLAPHVLVLAHCDLVAPRLLSIAREAVVNVHPALLPWIRGNSPIGNSLLRGVPLGATTFRVDAGIDTGAILHRRLVRLGGGETLPQLRDALFQLWVEMTADLVEAARSGTVPEGDAHGERFPLCRSITARADLAAVDTAVAEDRAKALFDRWAPACEAPGFTLPSRAERAVTPGAGT